MANETDRPDILIIVTDEERAAPPYEGDDLREWRRATLPGRSWFDDNAITFTRHYTGSLACVPSRPTMFTGHYPDLHGVTQTDGIGKQADDSAMRWLREGEVPTLGHWMREAGYDTHYDGKWHISHADLVDPDTGGPLATNDDAGVVDDAAVARYLEENPLDAFGFDGWVGPEPHGAPLANSGLRRDPLIAERVVAWLEDRFARRREGDTDAQRPFLVVASFVNPHDIVLWPGWSQNSPIDAAPSDPPDVPEAPTAGEDLADKPAIQSLYRDDYPTGYGPRDAIASRYRDEPGQAYRNLYMRLHAEVDEPLDRVRRAFVDGTDDAVVVRTSDHGELLGSHGGLHQKWYTLYDEATRVPFQIVRVGASATAARTVDDMATSHVDIVPTVLGAAGVDVAAIAQRLSERFSESHDLPGRDLMPVVDTGETDPERVVYLATRDHILDGDDGISLAARMFEMEPPIPDNFLIDTPAAVGTAFEGVVARVPESVDGSGHRWKLVRNFDDPDTWTTPGVEHRVGDHVRTEAVDEEWELYDLDADPIEADNRASDTPGVFGHLRDVLASEAKRCVPERNTPWPYRAR